MRAAFWRKDLKESGPSLELGTDENTLKWRIKVGTDLVPKVLKNEVPLERGTS